MKGILLASAVAAAALTSGCENTTLEARVKRLEDRVAAIEEQVKQMRAFRAGAYSRLDTRTYTITCKPGFEYEKVRDQTRLGWHQVVWLVLAEGDRRAKVRWAGGRAYSTPQGPVKLDPKTVYTFTVRQTTDLRPETLQSTVRIAKGSETLYQQ